MKEKRRCQEMMVPSPGLRMGYHQCQRPGVCLDPESGKWFCKQHSPQVREKRKSKQISCAWKEGCSVRVGKEQELCAFHRDVWRAMGPREYTEKLERTLKRLLRTAPCTYKYDLAKANAERVLKEKVSPFRK